MRVTRVSVCLSVCQDEHSQKYLPVCYECIRLLVSFILFCIVFCSSHFPHLLFMAYAVDTHVGCYFFYMLCFMFLFFRLILRSWEQSKFLPLFRLGNTRNFRWSSAILFLYFYCFTSNLKELTLFDTSLHGAFLSTTSFSEIYVGFYCQVSKVNSQRPALTIALTHYHNRLKEISTLEEPLSFREAFRVLIRAKSPMTIQS